MAFNTRKLIFYWHLILRPAECNQIYNLAQYEKKVGHAWFTSKEQQRNITYNIKKIIMIYFGSPLGDQGKIWALYKLCSKCC